MWEAQDLSGADKVNLMSAADRIPITGFTSNATTCTTKHLYIHKHISNLGSHHFSLLMQQILSVLSLQSHITESIECCYQGGICKEIVAWMLDVEKLTLNCTANCNLFVVV